MLLLPLTHVLPGHALDLDSRVGFNARWEYQLSGGDDRDTLHTWQQRYSLGTGAGAGLTMRPTHAITAGANVGYTRGDNDTGEGVVTREVLTPSAFFGLTNDIFRLRFTGDRSEGRTSAGQRSSSRSWGSTLASNWDQPWWPNLRLSYSESRQSSTAATRQREDTRRLSDYGFNLDWEPELELVDIFYNYRQNQQEDHLNVSQSRTDSHLLRLETGGRFWQNRANFSLSQQFRHSTSDFSIQPTEDDFFALPLREIDDPATDCPEELAADFNLCLAPDRFDPRQQVDIIRLYLDLDPTLDSLTEAEIAELQWQLFTRELSDDPWGKPAADNIPAELRRDDTTDEIWLELSIDRPVWELLVATEIPAFRELPISRLEIFEHLTEDATTRRQSHLTDSSLRLRLTDTITASSNLSLENSESERNDDRTVFLRLAYSGNLRWTPADWVSSALSYSETFHEESFISTRINRTYSLTNSFFPLPSLTFTLGAARTDRYTGTDKIATSDRYSLNSTARLYPDLTAGLLSSYSTTRREEGDGNRINSDSLSNRLTLNARLRPSLTADLTFSHRRTSSDTASSSSRADATTSLAYRPSDLLSMRFISSHSLGGPEAQDTMAYNLSLAMLRTERARLTFRYSHNRGAETRNVFGLNGSWDINRNLVLQSRFNYQMADADVWNILTTLALRL